MSQKKSERLYLIRQWQAVIKIRWSKESFVGFETVQAQFGTNDVGGMELGTSRNSIFTSDF